MSVSKLPFLQNMNHDLVFLPRHGSVTERLVRRVWHPPGAQQISEGPVRDKDEMRHGSFLGGQGL